MSGPNSPIRAPTMGVDIGATLAKLAVRPCGADFGFEWMPSAEPQRRLERIREIGPESIGLTGGGATRIDEALTSPRQVLSEFEAWKTGARKFLDVEEIPEGSNYLLVSLGTGTSVLLIHDDTATRIGGTALGGGTILGLGAALVGTNDFAELCALASRGARSAIDLVVSDIYRSGEIELPDDLTAAAFGKLGIIDEPHGEKAPEDLAAAIMGLVGENVGLICVGISYATQVENIVFGGTTLRENPAIAKTLEFVTRTAGRRPAFLPHGEYTGAVGALLLAETEQAQ